MRSAVPASGLRIRLVSSIRTRPILHSTTFQIPYVPGTARLLSAVGPSNANAIDLASLISIDSETGAITYDPSGFAFLARGASVTYTIAFDSRSGPDTLHQTLTLTIDGVNDAPVITSAAFAVDEGGSVVLTASDIGVSDPDSTEFTFTVSNVAHGRFEIFTGGVWTIAPTFTSDDLNAGHVRFVHDGSESAPTFSIQAIDEFDAGSVFSASVDVIEAVPTATANTNSVVEGGVVTGNVLTDGPDDVFGADGAAATVPAGGVTGVAAGSTTSVPVSGGVGAPIAGTYGVLTLNANGTYSYDGNANVVAPAGATDTFVYTITDGDGDTSTVTLTITLTDAGLVASNDDVTVNEAALPTGSDPSSPAETVTGTLADNVTPGVVPYTYALLSSPTGTHGTLTLDPDGSYSYTLTSTVDGATADNGITTENNADTFTYQVTDANGNTATSTITIDVVDDVPAATADTNSVVEGGVVTGNVLTDCADDVFGADGATATAPAGGVTGVAAGSNTSSPVSGGLGVPVAGTFGVLTLNADGSYSYDGNPNVVTPAGATDTFVYTITDGDGDTSTVTLTISLTDSGFAASNDDLAVNEAALATGSNPSSLAETVTGTVADNVTPGVAPYTYALLSSPSGTHGTLTFNANGAYSYMLTTPVDGGTLDNGVTIANNVETFAYQVTDANGNTTTSTITIDVIDDVPTATADTNNVVEGSIVTGNVLSDGPDDVFGADGAAATVPAGGVTGVAAGSNTSVPVSGGVGAPIAGSYGVLTLNADGTYSYDGNANVVATAGATDTFVYTITDGDGDTSTVTLSVALTDSGLAASNDDLTVNEAALATGSNPASPAETVTGTVADNVTPGVAPFTYALLSSPTGTHGMLTFNPDGSFSYTLATPVDGATSNNGIATENNVETFAYQVTDANGNTTTSTITIDVIDDVPTATVDTNSVVEGSIVTGNVLTDGPNDVFGADGATATVPAGGVTGVAAGSNTSSPVSGGLGVPVTGNFGVLTLSADGSYSYDGNPNAVPYAGATDTFVYTITDGDGDTSTVTLTISLTDSGLAASNDDLAVNEAALATGSNPSSPAEAVTGTVADNVTPGAAPYTYTLLSSPTGTHGTLTFNPDGSFSYTLATPVDGATSNNGITTENNVETFAYQVTDANGNTATSTITIDVVDDVPVAETNASSVEGGTSQTVDIQFIVDMSGSMFSGSVSGVPTFDDNRAGLARYAMLELLQGNDQIQNVEFVVFGASGSATGSVWMDRTAAIAYVTNNANWTNRGGTDYDLALQTAINSFGGSRPLPAGQQTFVYFLSDGEPSSGIDSNGTGANVSIAEWEAHLATQGVDQVFALGIGTASVGALNPIAYPKVDPPGAPVQYENVILVSTANVDDLPNTFQDLLGIPSFVSGNILLDDSGGTGADSFGADGGRILSITVNGVTYAYLPGTNQIDPSTGPNIPGSTLTVLTALGGTFTFNFIASGPDAAGSWSYLTDNPGAENFSYVLLDNDGDQVSSALNITVTAANHAPRSSNDSVATGEDTTVILALSDFGTYADADGTPIASVRITTLENNGSLEFDTTGAGTWAAATLNQDIGAADISAGRLRFVPDTNENGAPYTMVGFRVSDGTALSAAAYTLTVNVTAVNDAPVTNPDTVITNVGASAAAAIPTAWLLANDTDLESGVPSTVAGVGGASSGSVSGPSGGNVTFTDNATLDGSFTYQASDASLSGAAATVTVDNNTTATTTLVGGAGSEIFVGGATDDTIRGAGGNDFINGAGGTDLLDFSDGTAGITFTLVQSSSDAVVNLSGAGLGTDTYRNMEGAIGTSLADTVSASAAGGLIDAGAGGDTVNINAGTTGGSRTVDLGSDLAQDKIVFTHAALATGDNTVVTVSNFNVANDRIAVTLGAAAIADGAFQTVTAAQTTISAGVEVVELVNAAFVTGSLTNDSNNGAIETIIAAATNGIATGNYTFIVYLEHDRHRECGHLFGEHHRPLGPHFWQRYGR